MSNNLDKLKEVICFIISIFNGELHSKTKLAKLTYLVDFKAKQNLGKTITGATYKSYFYGAYPIELDKAIEELKKIGVIKIETGTFDKFNREYFIYKLNYFPSFCKLTNKEKKLILEVSKYYKNKTLEDILMDVYTSKPYVETNFGEIIKL